MSHNYFHFKRDIHVND